jgi:hypothetical protein
MTQLDGRNIFQWRHEYAELVSHFTKYADHTPECGSRDPGHRHLMMHTGASDPRAVCEVAPCTCGVLVLLSVMLHPLKFSYSCPDRVRVVKPDDVTVPPHTIFGLPVFESEHMPEGVIVLARVPKLAQNEQDTSEGDAVPSSEGSDE